MGLFSKRKLAVRKGFKYQYGKSPVFSRHGPVNFHTKTARSFSLKSLFPKIPKRAKKITGLLLATGVIFFLIYSVSFSNYFQIAEIQAKTKTKSNIQGISTNILNSLKDIKGQNLLWLDKQDLVDKIKNNFPEIENIEITRDFPSTLVIEFDEYPIIANLTNITGKGANKKFLISSIGNVVKENESDPNLPYINLRTEEPINPENIVISAEKLKYILDAILYYKEKFGMKILEVEYKVTPREIHLKTEKLFWIWLDIQKPFEDQFKKLKKALVKLDIFNEPLEYIDLRITGESGEKIIYRRKK